MENKMRFLTRLDAKEYDMNCKNLDDTKRWSNEDIRILYKIEDAEPKSNGIGDTHFPWGLNPNLQYYMIEQYKLHGNDYLKSIGTKVEKERKKIGKKRES
tara:strand:- start:922 stop:1221 length:300 start_codon:yes stop_codon:yes gene_type:complete